MIATIDGPSGAGKSTVSRILANNLGFRHIDSGAIYRALTLIAARANKDIEKESLENFFKKLDIRYEFLENGEYKIIVNGRDVSKDIRSDEVSRKVGIIADKKEYRNIVNAFLRDLTISGDFVLDGRDMGSEVFPSADVKFYLTASIEERAKRR
jgi:cytidylate kinase